MEVAVAFGEVKSRLKRLLYSPGSNYFLLGAAWGTAAIPCLCPACLAGPAVFIGRGAIETVPALKKIIG